jgi:cytochrome b6-f complex iron-sulfur subunit
MFSNGSARLVAGFPAVLPPHRALRPGATIALAISRRSSRVRSALVEVISGTTRFDRRSFLDAVLGVGFVSTAIAIAYPVARFLIPPASGEPATASAVAVRSADGELHAFSAVCTHLDCTVQYKADISQLWCACHNGYYDLGGNVVSGPPPRALERFALNLRGEPGEEEIVVSRA